MKTIIKVYWCYLKHNYFNEMFKNFKQDYEYLKINEFGAKMSENQTIDYSFYFELLLFKENPKDFMKNKYESSTIKNVLN